MGNSSTKEARQPHPFSEQASSHAAEVRDAGSRPRGRAVRTDLGGLLGIATNAPGNGAAPLERRETRQEREARRLERERQARLMERERSMREEHVDGGYLVTLGTYVGTEDFNKAVVRQLQIERRLAPFWRGLQDFSDTWTEYQLAAAARGLEVPPPDQPPPEGFFSRPTSAPSDPSTKPAPGHHTLTVPPGDKPGGSGAGSGAGLALAAAALSTSTPTSASASPSVPVGSLAGTSSPAALSVPTTPTTARASTSPFKPRAKALAAALSVSSRNGSSTDIAPREIQLPHDPFVNGQPIEVFLYKNADECPICFLSYPPYLNHTRCCGQAICSECFVQIKRTEPHYPEGHGDTPGAPPATDLQPEEQAGQLISEPACCPYCQQADFGVTYDPPPFRRGLVHSSSMSSSGLGGMGAAMSSSSSVNSAVSPTSLTSPNNPNLLSANSAGGTSTPTSRRRTQSLSATAPNVVTTDRVRPDWATKLAAQRAHIARRAAAATALHTAAFLMGAQENRPFRVGRFSRRNTSNTNNSNNNSNNNNSSSNDGDSGPVLGAADSADSPASVEPGPRSSSAPFAVGADGNSRRTRMEDLEELMFREALRQSLATEEERRRKEEKEARKEAKRREKEERKAAKAALKQQRQQGSSPALYGAATGTDSGTSSASASSLSLSGLGIGNRRRGNSAASTNLRVEASVAHAMAVSGGGSSGGAGGAGPGTNSSGNGASSSASSTANPIAGSSKNSAVGNGNGNGNNNNGNGNASANSSTQAGSNKGKAVDRGLTSTPETDMETDAGPSTASSSAPRLIPSPQPSAGPSHLRQMSNASSVSSSLPDSTPGSYQNMAMHLHDPRASGLSLGSRSATSEDGDHGDDRDPSTSTEPMFNFSSLAEIVGVQLEGRHAGRRLSAIGLDEDDTTTSSGAKADAAPTDEAPAVGPTPPKQGSEAFPTVDEHLEHAEPENASKPSAPAVTSTAEFKQPPQVMVTPGTPAPTSGFE